MKITVWGNELPAWTAAAALAECGNYVTLVTHPHNADSSTEFNTDNEPGLPELITATQHEQRLNCTSESEGYQNSLHILSLQPDEFGLATQIISTLATHHPQDLLIINQSNFGVGSSDRLQELLNEESNQAVVYMPDMLAEGSALKNFKQPQTLILGSACEQATQTVKALMRPFSQAVKQWLIMSRKEAEFSKFANTGMLALRLGYINELANLADKLEVDIEVVREALISDPRIGPHYLHPGCGFGGLHFQQYIVGLSELMEENRNSKLLDTVLAENEKQKEQPFRKLWRHYECNLQGRTISLWGLSFKPGTASIDNAPSLKVIETLLSQGCKIRAHDPEANANIAAYFDHNPNLSLCQDSYSALEGSDALLVLTEWSEYWSPDYAAMKAQMNAPLIIDGRNIFDKALLKRLGFTYYGVGR